MEIFWERNGTSDGRPVYRQIADAVRGAIEGERLARGTRLPPIRELAEQLGVNRDTVATAYEALAADGVVESTVGRGTFVANGSRRARAGAPPFVPTLAPGVQRLLDFERARPRFGSARGAVAMHSLVLDPSLYPTDAFRRALGRVLAREGADLLLYGSPQGDPALREALARHMRGGSLALDADDLVLCHGASQGIALALRLFCAPGDTLAVEEPTYNNVLGAALALGVRTTGVPMREDGVDLDALEATLARPEVKAFYTIPTFHNPTGVTTSAAHRRALLERASRAGVPVIEDGYEMDLGFAGRPAAPLAGLDEGAAVVHLFSFSKALFPGARVGAVSARGPLREALLALKQASDLSDALSLQAALAELVASGAYDRHLSRLRRVLRSRCHALLEALAAHMPEGTRWTEPGGGLQVWVELPGPVDTRDLLADAVAEGVLFAPGFQFYPDARPSNALRLTFAMTDEAGLRRGVERLARVARRRPGVREAPAALRAPV